MSEVPGVIASIAGMAFLIAGKELMAMAGQEIMTDAITILDTTLPMINLVGIALVAGGVYYIWKTY